MSEQTQEVNFRTGRAAIPVEIYEVTPIKEADLEQILGDSTSSIQSGTLKNITARHHRVAMLLAEGHGTPYVCRVTSYTRAYIGILQQDPAFKELLHYYQDRVRREQVDSVEEMSYLEASLLDKLKIMLDEDNGELSPEFILKAFEAISSRVGHPAVSRSDVRQLSAVVNASDLENLRSRSNGDVEERVTIRTPLTPSVASAESKKLPPGGPLEVGGVLDGEAPTLPYKVARRAS